MKKLYVYMNTVRTGVFCNENGLYSFIYDTDYISHGQAIPLSPRLPLCAEPFNDKETRVFFTNLVPEGSFYAGMCRMVRVDVSDKFGFLARWGRECAGALVFTTEPVCIRENDDKIQLKLDNFYKRKNYPLAFGPENIDITVQPRMSLAGGQDKTPVIVENDTIFYPLGNTPSTHILKANVQGYEASARNEVFCLHLAGELGLPVPESFVIPVKGGAFACIRRYDRLNGTRLHQIDFCQALGILPEDKYQEISDNYNYLQAMLNICEALNVKGFAGSTVAEHFAKAMCYNYLIKNTDAHAKNFSLLYVPNENGYEMQLSPLYDLNSMHIYNVQQTMSMSYGGELYYHNIRWKNFALLADLLNIDREWMHEMLSDMAKNIPDAASDVARRHAADWKNAPCYAGLVRRIKNASVMLLQFLTAGKGTD